jgi:hypothetical protein
MRHADLLLSSRPGDDLLVVATAVFDALDVANFEERFSVNHAGGHYFRGESDVAQLKVMHSFDAEEFTDNDGYEDLPFWLRLEASNEVTQLNGLLVHDLVRSKLIPLGFNVAFMHDFGLLTEKRVDYSAST